MENIVVHPVATAIKERRTVRAFKEEPVSKELIAELLELSAWAPNHKLREPWRFIAFFDEGREVLKQAIMQVPKPKPMSGGHAHKHGKRGPVPCQIVVVMSESSQLKEREEDYAATCALIQNFQLAAWEVGLGVTWVSAPFIHANEFKEGIGVTEDEKVVALLNVGYPENIPAPSERQPIEQKLTIIDRASIQE